MPTTTTTTTTASTASAGGSIPGVSGTVGGGKVAGSAQLPVVVPRDRPATRIKVPSVSARRPPASFASALTLSAIALASRAFLRTTATTRVGGVEHLHHALGIGKYAYRGADKNRRGVITICNHNSVVDDPMMWSLLLPLSTYLPFAGPAHTCRNNRWTLGASDIMFTNPVTAGFFGLGQVVDTVRGAGIYQLAVQRAIQKLDRGGWVHMFPEGRVNQPNKNPDGGMYRFKWGVGRIIMDAEEMPEIIPMWISGFDKIMSENRGFPRFMPRPGASVSVSVGESLTPRIAPMVAAWRAERAKLAADPSAPAPEELDGTVYLHGGPDPARAARIAITAALQEGVRELGEVVEGDEGRFARGEWAQSRRRPGIGAAKAIDGP